MNKEQLKEAIMDVASSDESFLMDTLNGLDLMMDAVNASVARMKKNELLALYEEAQDSIYFVKEEGDEQ